MCVGNKAPQATFWINKQVQALWELAQKCVDKHSPGIKPGTTEILLSTALAQLCVGSHPSLSNAASTDLDFHTTFDAPELDFVCNHEVVVTFKLKSGHFKVAGKDKKFISETFKEYHCAFRVPFKQHVIVDRNADQAVATKAAFLILDLTKATFIHEHSGFKLDKLPYDEADRKRRAILNTLTTEYLPLLARAGFTFIYSLPAFNRPASPAPLIDWSALTADTDSSSLTVCGISVAAINAFLKARWLEAAWRSEEERRAGEHAHGHGYGKNAAFALAERLITIGDLEFHAFFAPPRVRALCAKETVFYLDLPEIVVHGAGPESVKWVGWTIAVVVDVLYKEEEGGMVQHLTLDFTTARFCETLSSFGKDKDKHHWALFVEYICTHYLTILTSHLAHIIYHVDLRPSSVPSPDDGPGHHGHHGHGHAHAVLQADPAEEVCVTETFGFDFLAAVTQTSVNAHLKHRHATLSVLRTSRTSDFECTFGPPRVQLQVPPSPSLGGRTVVLVLALTAGWLKVAGLGHGVDKYEFKNWHVAFEVPLKLTTEVEADASHMRHHLILDIQHAQFRPDFSSFPGLLDDHESHLMRLKYIATIHHLRSHYLPTWLHANTEHLHLHHNHHHHHHPHILYTLPSRVKPHVWAETKFSITEPDFQVYHAPCGRGAEHRVNRGVIVVCAMVHTPASVPRPSLPLPESTWTWRACGGAFHGTSVLSRAAFLDRWRMHGLDEVNACTTLIPKLGGVDDASGDWRFKLVTLREALGGGEAFEWIKGRPYGWEGGEGLVWKYENHDVWSYRHVGGAGRELDGTCTISCKTENVMEIPTGVDKDGCKVEIKGLITLEMTFCGEKKDKQWTTKASASWAMTVTLSSAHPTHAVHAQVRTTRPAVSAGSGFSGAHSEVRASFKDAATLLRGEMGQMEGVMRKHGVDGEGIAAGLNVRFAGGWELWRGRGYTYKVREPRFNGQGDLVLGLEPEYEGSGKVMRNGNGNGHGNGVVPEVPVLSGENPGSGIKVAVLNALNGNKGGAPKVSPKVAPIGI